jgi:hypothetical protein
MNPSVIEFPARKFAWPYGPAAARSHPPGVVLFVPHRRSEETADPIVDLSNRGVSVAGIARERLTAKRSRPEMAPQRLEKIESAPGNGMGSVTSKLQHLVLGRGLTVRASRQAARMPKLQKMAPNALKSLDAELKSAPAFPREGHRE